jgi:hypothetical protein
MIEADKLVQAVEARFAFRIAITNACNLPAGQQRVAAVYDATKALLTACQDAGFNPLEIISEQPPEPEGEYEMGEMCLDAATDIAGDAVAAINEADPALDRELVLRELIETLSHKDGFAGLRACGFGIPWSDDTES